MENSYGRRSVWKGWGDFTGTGRKLRHLKRDFLSFKEARRIAQSYRLKSRNEWKKFSKRATNIPYKPNEYYNEFISWADWLGYK